jgi:putative transposase
MKRYVLLYDIDLRVHELFQQVARENGYELLAYETMPEHAHLLIGLNSGKILSAAVKKIKGISARRIFQEFPLLKQQIRSNNLWARSYAYKEVQKEVLANVIKYINNQKKDLFYAPV